MLGGDAVDGVAGARDERDACAAGEELADERQAQPGRAARHGDVEAGEDMARDVGAWRCRLRSWRMEGFCGRHVCLSNLRISAMSACYKLKLT